MFEAGVFPFSVFTDDAEVNVVVPGVVSWYVLDEDYRGVDVEFLSEGNVERLVS